LYALLFLIQYIIPSREEIMLRQRSVYIAIDVDVTRERAVLDYGLARQKSANIGVAVWMKSDIVKG
jgi:hypothetical protein